MTHHLSNFNVKVLTNDHDERWYLFFRITINEPFLMLSEFDMEALAGVVKYEKEEAKK